MDYWLVCPGFGAVPWPAGTIAPTMPFPASDAPPRQSHLPMRAQEPAVVDASNLGSPLVLDKGWRVGISSDPAASSAEFDDSNWAVRDAKGTIADVKEPDDSSDHSDHDGQICLVPAAHETRS